MANEYAVNQADLKAVADAIRSKGGTSDALTFPGGFVDAVGAIQSGGGGGIDTMTQALNGELVSYENDTITYVPTYWFYQCYGLKEVSFPSITKANGFAFYGCTSLETVHAPKLTIADNSSFNRCSSLKNFDFSKVTNLGASSFYGCSSLKEVVLPAVNTLGTYVFHGCTSLSYVDIANKVSIGQNVFVGCAALSTLVLRSNTLCALTANNVFTNTPFASGGTGGTVYVPAALLDQYRTATNWSTLYSAGTCNFVAIEGSEYE